MDDVLTFYERQIRDKALAVNEQMTTFLESQNVCDGSDPFFALLCSTDVKVRNYTALRQAFHQTLETNELSFDAIEQGSERDDAAHPIDDIDEMVYSSFGGGEAISICYDTDERRLRQWLDENRLAPSLMKELNRLGASNVDDVLMLAGSDQEIDDWKPIHLRHPYRSGLGICSVLGETTNKCAVVLRTIGIRAATTAFPFTMAILAFVNIISIR